MANNTSILIIDGHTASLEILSAALSAEGVRIYTAADTNEGVNIVLREHPRVVLADAEMQNSGGLDALDRIVEFDSSIEIILVTARSTIEPPGKAIRKNEPDCVKGPLSISILRERISELAEEARRRNSRNAPEEQIPETAQFEGMIGASPRLREMCSRIRRVAPYYRTAIITGETGTGKELAARALHSRSPVSNGPFVVLNCSAVVETLFESELFGHVRGSFTGADRDKVGLFEFANRGTIFLDEIGELPVGTQAKLLRTLQNQEVLRVGSVTPRKIDVRVIAATNRNLGGVIADKKLRQDLYYRLSMVEIRTPSLSERMEDIPMLSQHIIEKFSGLFRREVTGLTKAARIALERHTWPGNVRELENALGHGCMMATGQTIEAQDLPEYLWSSGRHRRAARSG